MKLSKKQISELREILVQSMHCLVKTNITETEVGCLLSFINVNSKEIRLQTEVSDALQFILVLLCQVKLTLSFLFPISGFKPFLFRLVQRGC